MTIKRRQFNRTLGLGSLGLVAGTTMFACGGSGNSDEKNAEEGIASESEPDPMFFSVSLAQWSLHRSYFGKSFDGGWQKFSELFNEDPASVLQGEIDPVNFPALARKEFGIGAVEYVNRFFYDKSDDTVWLNELNQRAKDNDVKNLLIMVDDEGALGDLNEKRRLKAVENHYRWVNTAKYLGCHSIRVNAGGNGTREEVSGAAVDGLGRLSEYGAGEGINVIVENHGGYSSDAEWLSSVIREVGNEYCGTLPDFGNFCIESGPDGCTNMYDRYKGVRQLMPYAKGVSAKSYAFDMSGKETQIDYVKMLEIIKKAGYTGHVGIEFEGSGLSEFEGIKATHALLKSASTELS